MLQDHPASIGIITDMEKTDAVGPKHGAKRSTTRALLLEKLIIACGKLAHNVPKLPIFKGQEHIAEEATDKKEGIKFHLHSSSISFLPALLIVLSITFYLTGGMDTYVLPKIVASSLIVLAIALTSRLQYSAIQPLLMIYFFCLCISSLFSYYPGAAVFGQFNNHSSGVLPTALLIMAFMVGHGADTRILTKSFILATTACGLICIAQQFGFMAPFHVIGGRSYGTLGSPAYVSGILAAGAIAALFYRHYLAVAALSVALLTTQSRAGIAALAAGLVVYLLSTRKRGLAAVMIGASLLVIGFLRVNSTINHSRSDKLRMFMFTAAIDEIKAHPSIGVGPEQFLGVFEKSKAGKLGIEFRKEFGQGLSNCHSHNSIVESLLSTGILGTLIASLIFLFITLALLEKGEYCLISVLATMLAYSMFQPLVISMKIPIAVLLGSGISVCSRMDKRANFAVCLLAMASCATFGTMYLATRVARQAGIVGDMESLGRMEKIYPPLVEKNFRYQTKE